MILIPSVLCFFAFLLFRSACAKLRQPALFWTILRKYPGGAWFKTPGSAGLVPAMEMVFAAGLALGNSISWLAMVGTLVFIGIGTAGIFWRFHKGETQLACGCSGDLEEKSSATVLLARNLALLAVGLLTASLLYGNGGTTRPGMLDFIAGGGLLLSQELLAAAVLQEERVRRWKVVG